MKGLLSSWERAVPVAAGAGRGRGREIETRGGKMPYVELSGRKFYFEEKGAGEPLLAISGLGATVESWLPIAPELGAQHRLIRFDNRDVGRSWQASEPYCVADMAADALELADALDIKEMHVLGHSMGSTIAQEIVLAAPQRIKTLTLMGTWTGGQRWWRARAARWAQDRETYALEEFVRSLLPELLAPAFYEDQRAVEELVQLSLDFPHLQTCEAFVRQCGACGAHDTQQWLHGITTPTHVIGAEFDVMVPVWNARETAALIPDSEFSLIGGSGHSMAVEKPAETSAAVLEFIGRCY